MALRRRMRDLQRCLKNVQSFSDNQATVLEYDTESLEWITIQIKPTDGFYHGGQFDFKIVFESTDPLEPPRVDCLTKIYHPNISMISEHSNVCLSLFYEWEEQFGLEDIIQGLLFLLYNPNIDDPLLSNVVLFSDIEETEMSENVQKYLHGEKVEGMPGTPPENVHERYDKKELAEGIQLILDKASQMLLVEDEDEEEDEDDEEDEYEEEDEDKEEDDDEDEYEDEKEDEDDMEDNMDEDRGHTNSGFEETDNDAGIFSIISRQESRVNKTDTTEVINTSITQSERRRWHSYIPQTFTPAQPDFPVNAVHARVTIQIRPIDGFSHGGQFDFKIVFKSTDPMQSLRIDCFTKIYHPHISITSKRNVCLSLFDEWEEQFGLEYIIQRLLFLLYNPNIDDPGCFSQCFAVTGVE